MKQNLPLITVIIPCLNEEKFIGRCLDSIVECDYPKHLLEVLVVDGMSEDGSRLSVERYSRQYSFIRILDNPLKFTPVALNIALRHAQGEVVLWMNSHSSIERNYITLCVEALEKYKADCVGGIMKTCPQRVGFLGKTISAALHHPFGVGNSLFRTHTNKPTWVDTVFGACFRRDVFSRIGLFNECLNRGQDMEFSMRLKKAGGRTLLFPEAVIYYYARSGMRLFLKHNWANGVWAVLPLVYSPVMPVSLRHLVPMAFVLSLLGLILLSTVTPVGIWLLGILIGTYGILSLVSGIQVAFREDNAMCVVTTPVVFFLLHTGYGLGSLWGCLRALAHILKRAWRRLFDAA